MDHSRKWDRTNSFHFTQVDKWLTILYSTIGYSVLKCIVRSEVLVSLRFIEIRKLCVAKVQTLMSGSASTHSSIRDVTRIRWFVRQLVSFQ